MSDRKIWRKIERDERKAHDPWFGKKRVTSFKNKKKEHDKYQCRKKFDDKE